MKKIGKIVNKKGLKGEVKILSSSDFKDIRFKKGNKLFVKDKNEYKEVTISNWYIHKNFDIVKFKEFNYVDEVESIINLDLYGEELEDNVLEDDEFFFDDLLGFEVYEYEKIGKIISIFDQVGKTYLRIEKTNNKKVLLPYVDEFIKEVSLKEKKIYIESIPGLLDD